MGEDNLFGIGSGQVKRGGGKRIIVGLSGGVDSSVSMLLLKKHGWKPIGVSLKMAVWKSNKNALKENSCCTREALKNASKVCQMLGVPHFVLDVEKEFEKSVVSYFVEELKKGRTPNPCLVCNRDLKVKMLFAFAKSRGIEYVATGHYARIKEGMLFRAADMKKDQTYGLCLLPKRWLPNLILPLGGLQKKEVYEIAIKNGLEFYAFVPQSQDLCFVSECGLKHFLFEKIGKRKGDVVDDSGKRVGEHYGLFLYTIGQRRGIGLPHAHYVRGFDVEKNVLFVTRERAKIFSNSFSVEGFNWLVAKKPKGKFNAHAQIRTHQLPFEVKVLPALKTMEIISPMPIEGVASGQICALYQGELCIGGGAIV